MKRVILPIESSRGSGRALLRGIANFSRLHGPWSFHWEPGGLEGVLPKLEELNVDGIIMRDTEQLDEVLKLKIPTIVVRHHQEEQKDRINIITDSKEIAKLAIEHFSEKGLNQFGFCGYDHIKWSNDRCKHFSKRIVEQGYSIEIYKQPSCVEKLTWDKEYHFLQPWLTRVHKPIGLLTCNDDRGQQLLEVCNDLQIKVPEEVSLLGVDNDELVCELSTPTLSSISLNFERAGFEAAYMLDRWMNGEKFNLQNIIVPATHVVSRKSTEITALEDEYVVMALEFIQKNITKSINVENVVAIIPLSRRELERRFKRSLHRTIKEEIRRGKTNLIAQMLVETNYSILEIALSLGFSGVEHISRFFRVEKGMSLRQYRKQYGQK